MINSAILFSKTLFVLCNIQKTFYERPIDEYNHNVESGYEIVALLI